MDDLMNDITSLAIQHTWLETIVMRNAIESKSLALTDFSK